MEYSRKLEYLKREEELIKEEELEAEALLNPSSPTLQVLCSSLSLYLPSTPFCECMHRVPAPSCTFEEAPLHAQKHPCMHNVFWCAGMSCMCSCYCLMCLTPEVWSISCCIGCSVAQNVLLLMVYSLNHFCSTFMCLPCKQGLP